MSDQRKGLIAGWTAGAFGILAVIAWATHQFVGANVLMTLGARTQMTVPDARQPCAGCGYMIRGGSMCGDCQVYGPPKGWRWQYDADTGEHYRAALAKEDTDE